MFEKTLSKMTLNFVAKPFFSVLSVNFKDLDKAVERSGDGTGAELVKNRPIIRKRVCVDQRLLLSLENGFDEKLAEGEASRRIDKMGLPFFSPTDCNKSAPSAPQFAK